MSDEPQRSAIPLDQLLAEGVALHQQGHLDGASKFYEEILSRSSRHFDATHLLGVVALQQERFEVAQQLLWAAHAIDPRDPTAVGNLGTSYMRAGHLEPALQWYEIALKLQPDSPVAQINIASALHNVGRHRDAIPLLRKARDTGTNLYRVCNLLGACLIKCGDAHEAVEPFEAATAANPGDAEGWANLSVALNAIGQHERAGECADRALALKPQSSAALGAMGAAQFQQGRLAAAIESYRQGAALPAPSAQMLAAYGNTLLANGLNEEAIEQLERVVQLDGKNVAARWAMAMAQLKPVGKSESDVAASRRAFARAIDEVEAWYRRTEGINEPFHAVGVMQPFYLAYQPVNNRDLLMRYGAVCTAWMATLPIDASEPEGRTSITRTPPAAGRKLRIGIASAHIAEHSVWNAITKGWVRNIDRAKFDIYLFQLSPTADKETEDVKGTVAELDDQPKNPSAWAQAIKAKNLDVLVYPEIGMHPLTLQLASLRLAPVQASSWGHPETSGLSTMDFFISAEALEPANAQNNYSEKLINLPNLGVYVEPLAPAVLNPGLRSLRLPGNEPLLLCPGTPFKYSPLYDDVWVQIAKHLRKSFFTRRGGGRLVFFRSRSEPMDRTLEARLRAAFEKAGVGFDEHVSIIRSLDRARFFGLMRRSALMLDTLGFSGFNTALQAIECDLPVLAFEGEFMRGRLASSIMRRLDLPELVATTTEDFIQKAVALAGDSRRRRRLRAEIIRRRHVLFHDMAPVRSLEGHLADAVTRARG